MSKDAPVGPGVARSPRRVLAPKLIGALGEHWLGPLCRKGMHHERPRDR